MEYLAVSNEWWLSVDCGSLCWVRVTPIIWYWWYTLTSSGNVTLPRVYPGTLSLGTNSEVCRNAGACDIYIRIESWQVHCLSWIHNLRVQTIMLGLNPCPSWSISEPTHCKGPSPQFPYLRTREAKDSFWGSLSLAEAWGLPWWNENTQSLLYLVIGGLRNLLWGTLSLRKCLCWLVIQSTSSAFPIWQLCGLGLDTILGEAIMGDRPAVPVEVRISGSLWYLSE